MWPWHPEPLGPGFELHRRDEPRGPDDLPAPLPCGFPFRLAPLNERDMGYRKFVLLPPLPFLLTPRIHMPTRLTLPAVSIPCRPGCRHTVHSLTQQGVSKTLTPLLKVSLSRIESITPKPAHLHREMYMGMGLIRV